MIVIVYVIQNPNNEIFGRRSFIESFFNIFSPGNLKLCIFTFTFHGNSRLIKINYFGVNVAIAIKFSQANQIHYYSSMEL